MPLIGKGIGKLTKEILPDVAKGFRSMSDDMLKGIGKWWRNYNPPDDALKQVSVFNRNTDDAVRELESALLSSEHDFARIFLPHKNRLGQQMRQLNHSESKLDEAIDAISKQKELLLEKLKAYSTSLLEKENILKNGVKEISDNQRYNINNIIQKLRNKLNNFKPGQKEYDELVKEIKHYEDIISNNVVQLSTKEKTLLSNSIAKTKIKISEIDNSLRSVEKGLIKKQNELNYILKLKKYISDFDKITREKGLGEGLRYLDSIDDELASIPDHGIFSELTYIKTLRDEIKKSLPEHADEILSYKLTSENLNSWKNFLKEYAAIVSNKNEQVRNAWLANPQNKAKIDMFKADLHEIPLKFRKLFNKLEADVKFREKFVGTAPRDIAEKLKIPLGLVTFGATSAAVIKFLNWLSDNSPEKISGKIKNIKDEIKKLKTFGIGTSIVERINNSLDVIEKESKNLDNAMSSDPEKVASFYMPKITAEVTNLINIVEQWKQLETNVYNKEQSSIVLAKLTDFVKIFGQSASYFEDQQTDYSEDLFNLQRYVETNFDSSIDATGKKDQKTIQVLRNLEHHFNSLANTKEFTNAFVGQNNNIISYKNFIKMHNLIKKYQ